MTPQTVTPAPSNRHSRAPHRHSRAGGNPNTRAPRVIPAQAGETVIPAKAGIQSFVKWQFARSANDGAAIAFDKPLTRKARVESKPQRCATFRVDALSGVLDSRLRGNDKKGGNDAKKKRRGFNLIEMAIVVVILGILGSAILIPVSASLLEDQYDREEQAMARARMAVIGYAARSATPGVIIHQGGSTDTEDTYTVPAGRAYFPCPDITGDGLEDRNHFDATGQIVPDAMDIARIEVNAEGIVELDNFLINAVGNPDTGEGLLAAGACRVMRGLLPWKTLGLPPDDVWGNMRTYAVDYDYSHALVGFNRNTIADNFTAHQFVDANFNFPHETAVVVNEAPLTRNNINLPIGLCLGVATECHGNPTDMEFGGLNLALGDRVATARSVAHRNYRVNDLQDGLIFVIVSHGRNGKGAARYIGPPAGAAIGSCNPGDNGALSRFKETANYPFVQAGGGLAGNCNTQTTWGMVRSARFFTILRRNEEGNNTFDDILVWATREDINEVITRDSPDLPLYVQAP